MMLKPSFEYVWWWCFEAIHLLGCPETIRISTFFESNLAVTNTLGLQKPFIVANVCYGAGQPDRTRQYREHTNLSLWNVSFAKERSTKNRSRLSIREHVHSLLEKKKRCDVYSSILFQRDNFPSSLPPLDRRNLHYLRNPAKHCLRYTAQPHIHWSCRVKIGCTGHDFRV